MGTGKLMSELGVDQETAMDILAGYHERVPFVKKLMLDTQRVASDKGFLTTLEGRRCRFEEWESATEWGQKSLPLDAARREYGEHQIKRAWTFRL